MAKKFRNQDIAEIRTNYTKLKNDAVAELKKSVQPNLDSYKKQLDLNVSELQKTTYVFRSIDASDDYLSLNVDDYDGNTCSWTVHSAFKANDIVKFDASKLDSLPDTEISYEIMTGKKPATLASTKEDYREYLNLVERADLYFRVSVPYLYSQLAVKVTYDSVTDRYIAVPENFKIFKMENNSKALVEYKGSYFVAAEKREAEEARAEEIRMVQEETRRVQEEEQSRKKRERAATEEKYRQLIRAKLNAQRDFGRAMWANTDIVFNNLGVSIGGSLGITYPILGGLFVGADVGGYMSADEEASYGDMGITGTVDVGINFLFDASSSAGWYVKAGIGGAYGYPTGDGLMYRAAVGARYYGVGLEYSLDYVKDSLAADRLSLFYVFSF